MGFTWPEGTEPAAPPSGWNASSGGIGSDVYVEAYECQRVNWGPYERGPVRIVFESHTNIDPPAACQEGAFDTLAVLASFWISDAPLAAYLQTAYGYPARFAEIAITSSPTAATTTIGASWFANGTQTSSMETSQANTPTGSISVTSRLLWRNGNGTVVMDLQNTQEYGSPAVLVSAQMNPPMLNSSPQAPLFPGRGQPVLHASVTAPILRFSDSTCTAQLA